MEDACLDVADRSTMEAVLPAHHQQWGGGIPLEAYRACMHEREKHDWARHHVRDFVLRSKEGASLSTLRLYGVRGLHGDAEIRLGGIGEVLTPLELRGRGYAGRLLELTLALLKQEGVDAAYLFSDIGSAYYERFGFQAICSAHVDCPIERIPDALAGSSTVRPRRPADWEAIRRIHAAAGEGESLWLLRDDEQWGFLLERWQRWARYDPRYRIVTLDCVAERDGRTTGYAIALAELEEQTLSLLEFGTEAGDSVVLQDMLSALKTRALESGCARITAAWPPGRGGSSFRERFEAIPRSDGIFMIAALSARFDPSDLVARGSGFWETDHI